MFEIEKELLKKLCQKDNNTARQEALSDELNSRGIRYENWNDMALVVPSDAEKVIVLCAHYDAVPGSYGYNDNGMALVTALNLLHKLANVEFVFTNCEELGGLGAEYYLEHTQKQILGCVNLDVVGCYDQIYLDTMNFFAARNLKNCKQGMMPYSDAHVFAQRNIPSICFSSGPADTDFRSGIWRIYETLHNNRYDNNFGLLNFDMISKVGNEVKKAVELMQFAA